MAKHAGINLPGAKQPAKTPKSLKGGKVAGKPKIGANTAAAKLTRGNPGKFQ